MAAMASKPGTLHPGLFLAMCGSVVILALNLGYESPVPLRQRLHVAKSPFHLLRGSKLTHKPYNRCPPSEFLPLSPTL
eukprot:153439-Amorphochlora_amoeboformis.AAC.1